jgi:hypothetical protein
MTQPKDRAQEPEGEEELTEEQEAALKGEHMPTNPRPQDEALETPEPEDPGEAAPKGREADKAPEKADQKAAQGGRS